MAPNNSYTANGSLAKDDMCSIEPHVGARQSHAAANEERCAATEKVNAADDKSDTTDDSSEANYPTGLRLVAIILALSVTVFVVAVTATITATAIPTITSYSDSLDQVAWYRAAMSIKKPHGWSPLRSATVQPC